MAVLKKIEFESFGPYKMVGKAIRTKHEPFNPIFPSEYDTIPSLWKRCFSDGTFDHLISMGNYCPEETPEGYEGLITDYNPEDQTFTYLAGFLMAPNTPIPEGYDYYRMPTSIIAKAQIEGEEHDILSHAHQLTMEGIKKFGYEVDWDHYFACEVYTEERYGIPKRRGQHVLILDYYIPCIKIGE